MIVNEDTRRSERGRYRPMEGWTSLHSWIFLGIVAIGFIVIGFQNRYHYLNPQGLGKAYRIDKVFGSIQEFDPSRGWVKARLQVGGSSEALSMAEPPASGAVPANKPAAVPQSSKEAAEPGSAVQAGAVDKEETSVPAPSEVKASTPAVQAVKPEKHPELTKEEKFRAFKQTFPDFGKDEFQLANDDLYPDWKKNESPNGTWAQFLTVYGKFIKWWTDEGSPPEAGFKLWKQYLASKK
jgi:hypothetical protein